MDLAALGSPAGFIARHRRDGTLATYQISFLMVDQLVVRLGFASVVAYFRAFQEFLVDLATKRQ